MEDLLEGMKLAKISKMEAVVYDQNGKVAAITDGEKLLVKIEWLEVNFGVASYRLPSQQHIKDLAADIVNNGLIHPILVGEYNIIDGYCRLQAAKYLRWEWIPAILKT